MRRASVAAVVLMMSVVAPAHAAHLKITSLSDRPDVVSGGDVLLAVSLPKGVSAATVRVRAGRRNVTRRFGRRADGRFEGLVTGLKVGRTVLRATARHAKPGRLTIVNHPNGGPVLSGPQLQPWVCQSTANDAQCNQPSTYAFSYMSTTGGMQSYRRRPCRPTLT